MDYRAAPLLGAPPLQRYGNPIYELGTSPAAAAAFTKAVDGRFYARLLTVSARLVTDGNAANRTLFVAFLDAAGNRFSMSSGIQTQAASLTRDWFFNVFAPGAIADIDSSMVTPLAPLLLPPTFSWSIGIGNVQAADQLSRIRFYWELFYSEEQPVTEGDYFTAGIGAT